MRRVGDRYEPASHEEAVADIAARLQAIIAEHGPDAVGGFNGNPLGFSFGATVWHASFLRALGTHQVFSVQSVDSNSKHVASDGLFGIEMMALVPDVDNADFILLIGTNPAVSKFNWGGKVPNGWRRLKQRVRDGAELVVVDPRRTETAENATQHIAPLPESDWALLLGMIQVILAEGLETLPQSVLVEGFAELRELAASIPLDALARHCDIPASALRDLAHRFARAPRGFAWAGTGPALGMNGTLTHWLTLVLNLLTNRIEQPGGRFMPNWPIPWQNRLAQFTKPPLPRSRVRNLAPVAGSHSLAELADEITTPGKGQIRALFIGGGNPVAAGADGERLAKALDGLDLLVSVDLFQRESHRAADWLIPALHFLEREEIHVPLHAYNDRPYIQSTRQAIPPPPGMKPDWIFYRDLAAAMGLDLFGGAEMDPDRLAADMLASGGMVDFPTVRGSEHGVLYGERSMGHLWDLLAALDRPIQLCPRDFAEALKAKLSDFPAVVPPDRFQIISRRRNGMMNASLAESTGSHRHDETADGVEMNPGDASMLGLADGDAVLLSSAAGAVTARVMVSGSIRARTLVLAHGWGSPLYDPASGHSVFCKGQARNKLVGSSELDPLSAVPRLNGAWVTLRRAGPSDGACQFDETREARQSET